MAMRKSLPLEGKVPNECETDEVERESLLQPNGEGKGKRPLRSSPPYPNRKQKMPPLSLSWKLDNL